MGARILRPCGLGLLWILAASALAPAQTTEGAVSGLVVERHSGHPVKRALVTLVALPRSRGYATAVTDGEGRFLFTAIPPGKYRLAARKDGYRGAQFGTTRPNQPGRVISLAPGEHLPNLIFRLTKLAAISGVVVDEEGDPAPGIRVSLLVPDYQRGKKRLRRTTGATTNGRGEYRMFHVLPGRYYVLAMSRGRPVWRAGAEVSARDDSVVRQFARQFFPTADRLSDAAMVELLPGGELRGIDFRLRSVRLAYLSIRLQLPDELSWEEVQEPQIILRQHVEGSVSEGMRITSPSPGHETVGFRELFPGQYQVVGTLVAAGRAYRGVVSIDLGSGEKGEVTIALRPGADLRGSVRIEGRGADDYGPLEVSLSPGDDIAFPGPRPTSKTDEEGRFRLSRVLPGVWDIGVEPIPPGGYIKAMMLGQKDVLTEGMVIDEDTTAPLNIVISTEGAVVEGAVRGADGELAAQGFVLLIPEGRYAHVMSFRSVSPIDDQGKFQLRGIAPGAYKLFALDGPPQSSIRDANVTAPYAEMGSEIRAGEGERVERELTLIPATEGERLP